MYDNRKNYAVVGLFVSVMLIATVGTLALLTGRTGPTDPYFLVFDNVSDVKFGTQVRFEGYPIGQVDRVQPMTEGPRLRFRVDVSLEQGWHIPAGSVGRVGSSGFLAAKTIDIAGGPGPDEVPVGGQIESASPSDVFAAITATADQFGKLSRENVKPLLETLRRLAGTLESDAPQITEELVIFARRLNEELGNLATRVNATLAPIDEILADHNVRSVERSIGNAEDMTAELAAASSQLNETMGTIDHLVANVDQLIEANEPTVDQSLKDLQYTLASIAQTVDSVVHNLDGAARNMNEFSRLIRRNPALLLDGQPREAVSPARLEARDNDR